MENAPILTNTVAQVYAKRSFIGGMNQQVDATKIAENEYPLLFNGRSTFDKIKPVKLPISANTLSFTWTKVQGMFATDNILFVFADGKAYYKILDSGVDMYREVIGFSLSPTASEIYIEKIPSSSMNCLRVATASDSSKITLTTLGQSYPSALIVQDGVTQPQIIFDDLTSRSTNTYAQWTTDNREYVPIGKQMLFHNGILYVASPDGKRLLRSVTGRPADFMVVVDENGNKLPAEADGNADTVSYQVDYNPITSLHSLNTSDGSFLVSTTTASFMVTPSRDVTIFGEPTFNSVPLFFSSVLNQNSFIDVVGDSIFITTKGIRSFNAVYSTKWEGKNTPFSKKVHSLFEDIKQTVTASILFDEEHALFACTTIYGPCIVVYDVITSSFESIDMFPAQYTGSIVKFVQTTVGNRARLFCYTNKNEVMELYASDSYAKCSLYIGEWISPNSITSEQKTEIITVVLNNLRASGIFYATLYTDSFAQDKIQTTVDKLNGAVALPIGIPFIGTAETIRHINFPFPNSNQSWKIGVLLEWDFDVELVAVEAKSTKMDNLNCPDAQADELAYYTTGTAKIDSFSPAIVKPTQVVTVLGSGMQSVIEVSLNGIKSPSFAKPSNSMLMFTMPVAEALSTIKLKTVAGNVVESNTQIQCIP